MLKTNKIDFRAWINAIIMLLLVVVVMPFAIWKSCADTEKLNKSHRITTGTIIGIRGLKGKAVTIEYTINDNKYKSVRTAPSNYEVNIGNVVKLKYDTLDNENIEVIWEK